jgi:hypothetical protein
VGTAGVLLAAAGIGLVPGWHAATERIEVEQRYQARLATVTIGRD